MFFRNKKSMIGVLALVATLGMALFQHSVSAEEKAKIHLQISPVELKVDLEPGKTKTAKLKVSNLGAESFVYTMSTEPYQVSNNKYDLNMNVRNDFTKITDWIKFPTKSKSIAPGETDEVEFTITVPYDSPGGGQYAIVYASTSTGSGGAISATPGAGMRLLARVAGTTRRSGKIKNSEVSKFLFKPPIKASSLVESTSNVDVTAHYDFKVYNFFTGRLAYSNELDPLALKEKAILPNTEFLNDSVWEGSPQLGIFRVNYRVDFIDDSVNIEKVVIICPIWLLFLILTLIFLGVFWVVSRIKIRRTEQQTANY